MDAPERLGESLLSSPAIIIEPYTACWMTSFKTEAEVLRATTGNVKFYIDHVGSTSVSKLPSKPSIDILLSVQHWYDVKKLIGSLENLGYVVKEECTETPRYFLVKNKPNQIVSYHLHVCKTNAKWGRDMLVFRDELSASPELAKKYSELKQKLSQDYPNDLNAYTSGKTDFIRTVLIRSANNFTVDCLLTHQRKELDEAQTLQIKMMITQIILAAAAAFSVYVAGDDLLLIIAIIGFLSTILWLYYSQTQQKLRSAGDQARRAILLISGLGQLPPAGQKLRIKDSFTFPVSEIPTSREEDHFASREPPGYKRLSEIIEESAYWTQYLQRFSANVMSAILLTATFIAIGLAAYAIIYGKVENQVAILRTMLAFFVFLVSSDILGLLLSYRNSANSINDIFRRVEGVADRGYNESDTLLLMVDYVAAIEKSPPALPSIYKLRRNFLSQRWRSYIEAKSANIAPDGI